MKMFFDMYLLTVILVIFKYYTYDILYIYITHILIIYYKYDQHQHQTKTSPSNNNIHPISYNILFIIIIHNPKILFNSNNPFNKFRLIKNNRIR